MPRAKPDGMQFTVRGAIGHFSRDLRAADESPKTVETYCAAAELFATYAEARGVELLTDVDPGLIRDWLLALKDAGASDGTRMNRHSGLKAFWRWAEAEGLVTESPMRGVPMPRAQVKPPPVLTEAQLRALLRACSGKDFESVRDTALIRLLLDTGMRRSEALGLRGWMERNGRIKGGDLNLDTHEAIVRGKGNRIRTCVFGVRTAQALNRYLRLRAGHRDQHLPQLWLGRKGPLTANGLLQALRRRGEQAGIGGIYTHLFRHNLNGEWVRIKNFCTGSKSLSGWTIHDYGKKHTYRFPSGVSIKPGASMTLFSGQGTNTATKRFWGRPYGAVWNIDPPETAYLKNAAGTLQSKWMES